MTTPARIKEAEDASVAFQIALTQIGAKTVEDAIALWQDVPPDIKVEQATKWLAQATKYVMLRRGRTRTLSLAYYRLARALRTGTTIADPYHPEPTYISLDALRREFASLAGGQDSAAPPAESPAATEPDRAPQDSPQAADEAPEQPVEDDPDDDLILVEEIADLEAELARIEAAAEAETRDALATLGAQNLANKNKKIDTRNAADAVDEARAQAHAKAGRRQAASAERLVLNGARSTVYTTGSKDTRVIGWIRLSRTGTPCGWCAMLISRGFTDKSGLYKSASAAQRQGKGQDEDKYHDNCKCYAEPVYSTEQLTDSPRYALNREYARLWPQVTKGLGGDAALSAWRNFIRRQQATAQAASAA